MTPHRDWTEAQDRAFDRDDQRLPIAPKLRPAPRKGPAPKGQA